VAGGGVAGAALPGAHPGRAVAAVPELRHPRDQALAGRAARGRPPGPVRRPRAPGGAPRRRQDRPEGPGDPAPGRRLAPVDVLPPAGRPRRGRPDGHRVRDQRRRAGLDLARHRPERPVGTVGRPRDPGQRGVLFGCHRRCRPRRHDRRVLRRPGQRRRELRGADRDRHRHRAGRADRHRHHGGGRVALRGPRAAVPGRPSARWRPAPALLRDDPARRRPRAADGAPMAGRRRPSPGCPARPRCPRARAGRCAPDAGRRAGSRPGRPTGLWAGPSR